MIESARQRQQQTWEQQHDLDLLCLPKDDPSYQKVRAVLDRLLASTGLTSPPWDLAISRLQGDTSILSSDRPRLFQFGIGLLRHIKSDDELAFLIGMLLGQTIAEHRREDINSSSLSNLSGLPWTPLQLPSLMLFELAAATGSGLLGLAAAYSLNLSPSSKLLESLAKAKQRESDYIGLLLMTDAGYDPAAAITAIESMSKAQNQRRPEGGILLALANAGNHSYQERVEHAKNHIPSVRTIISKSQDSPSQSEITGVAPALKDSIERWQAFLASRRSR